MVKRLPAMTDMSLDDKEKEEISMPSPPKYPYGLCICLCQDELEKLGMDDSEISVGDILHMFCLAKVTSVSSNENSDGVYKRVELQITNIATPEDEDEENRRSEKVMKKLYK